MKEGTNTSMSPQDWYGVGLRLFGIWSIFRGLEYFMVLVDSAANWSRNISMPNETILLYTLGYTGFGLILIGNARFLSSLAYAERVTPDDPDE